MKCRNCGAELAPGTIYCSECGHKIERGLLQGNVMVPKIAIVITVALFIGMLAGIAAVTDQNIEPDNGITLTGRYVVGEDIELPPGSYDIMTADRGDRIRVNIYASEQDEADDNELNMIYSTSYTEVQGYKLRDGYVVHIKEPGAKFIPTERK